eukprot:PITA_19952
MDKPGKENVVAEFVSRVNFPIGEEGMVGDQIPDEHLFFILVLSPWFADIENYLVSTQFPPHLSSKEKSKIVRKGAPFTWIGARITTFKILQAGYYWPTVHQDVRRYTSQYDQCQRVGKSTPKDEMPMQPQVTFGPFEKLGMDFVGPINPPSKQKHYTIVSTDYLTKWAETKEIKVAIEEKVAESLRENIFYKFGYPRELVTNQSS